jgi:hypothetical protein
LSQLGDLISPWCVTRFGSIALVIIDKGERGNKKKEDFGKTLFSLKKRKCVGGKTQLSQTIQVNVKSI